jgi:hypothetical protein
MLKGTIIKRPTTGHDIPRHNTSFNAKGNHFKTSHFTYKSCHICLGARAPKQEYWQGSKAPICGPIVS